MFYDLGKTDVKNSNGKGIYKSLFYFISPKKTKSPPIGRLTAVLMVIRARLKAVHTKSNRFFVALRKNKPRKIFSAPRPKPLTDKDKGQIKSLRLPSKKLHLIFWAFRLFIDLIFLTIYNKNIKKPTRGLLLWPNLFTNSVTKAFSGFL